MAMFPNLFKKYINRIKIAILTSLDKLIIYVLEEETLNLSIEPLLFKVFLFGTKLF